MGLPGNSYGWKDLLQVSAQCGNARHFLKHPRERNNIYLLRNIMNRRYTKFYGTRGNAAANIAHDAILGNDWFIYNIIPVILNYQIFRD